MRYPRSPAFPRFARGEAATAIIGFGDPARGRPELTVGRDYVVHDVVENDYNGSWVQMVEVTMDNGYLCGFPADCFIVSNAL